MNVDFHIHTTYSDGGKTPEEIIELCKKSDIGYISITDHNTFRFHKENKKDYGLKIIRGMEVEVEYNKDITLHILLYNYDLNSKLLKEYYKKNIKYELYHFNKKIKLCEKLFNIKIDKNIKRKFIRNNNYFDRVRLNNLLVECNLAKDPVDAYYKYTKDIKENKRFKITIKDFFELEKDTKGVASLAHPLRYKMDLKEIEKIILELKKKYNLRVVEAINNRQTLEEEKELIKFCKNNNIYISCGSDSQYKFGETVNNNIGLILNRKIDEKEVTFLKLLDK
jgi:predicted metal-dependent phosphoesterase TrpH